MDDIDFFGFNESATAEQIFEAKASTFADQYSRHLGIAATVAWVQNGDPDADILAEVMSMTANFADDETAVDDDDVEDYSDVANSVADAISSFGVNAETASAAVEGDADAARRAFSAIQQSIDSSAQSVEDLLNGYTLNEPVEEGKADWMKAQKKRKIRQRKNRNKVLAPAKKRAVMKMLRAARRGPAKLKRAKTMKRMRSKGWI
jgi:hypothetical protein